MISYTKPGRLFFSYTFTACISKCLKRYIFLGNVTALVFSNQLSFCISMLLLTDYTVCIPKQVATHIKFQEEWPRDLKTTLYGGSLNENGRYSSRTRNSSVPSAK